MELKTDYSDIKFAENGKLKLLIICYFFNVFRRAPQGRVD